MSLPAELSFLKEYLTETSETFTTAIWLINDFDEPVWLYSLGFNKPKKIDWGVQLHDKSLLTAPPHAELLKGIKHFLILSTRTFGVYLSETNDIKGQQRKLFSYACHIIDLLLLNSKRYDLATHGLAGLTEGNLKEILEKIASDSVLSESIYDWSTRLRLFCIELINQTDKSKIMEALASVPGLATINEPEEDCDLSELPESFILMAKGALYVNNYYIRHSLFGWSPNTILLSEKIYHNTIWGRTNAKPTPEILCYSDSEIPYRREYEGIRVTTGKRGQLNSSMYGDYRNTLYHLGVLHELNLPAPPVIALVEADKFTPPSTPLGRHRTLPTQLVFSCLRNAINFHYNYGKTLTNEICRIALHCKSNNIEPTSLSESDFQNIITRNSLDLGIRSLGLSVKKQGAGIYKKPYKLKKHDYFIKLRENFGLIELIRVYIGAVQFVVGTLTARRVSELIGLNTNSCVDTTRQWIMFHNAKSTRRIGGLRKFTARPVEPIAVEMMESLARMQKILKRLGLLKNTTKLFASPGLKGTLIFINSSKSNYNTNLDFFCDYFETPLTGTKRSYIRQHQLRRFFAMLFFYSKSFGHLDTLRWMLAHTDASHVWHYITETTDGAVLQSAKAHYVADMLQSGAGNSFSELTTLLTTRYGTDDFRLIASEDLEDYIYELLCDGMIEIEPEFFTDEHGETFKIITKVKRYHEQ